MAFLAVILLGIGYASMIYMEKLKEMGILIALITTTAGTYMLFGSLLPVIIKKLKVIKSVVKKDLMLLHLHN